MKTNKVLNKRAIYLIFLTKSLNIVNRNIATIGAKSKAILNGLRGSFIRYSDSHILNIISLPGYNLFTVNNYFLKKQTLTIIQFVAFNKLISNFYLVADLIFLFLLCRKSVTRNLDNLVSFQEPIQLLLHYKHHSLSITVINH